jgi:hypothetical protein
MQLSMPGNMPSVFDADRAARRAGCLSTEFLVIHDADVAGTIPQLKSGRSAQEEPEVADDLVDWQLQGCNGRKREK